MRCTDSDILFQSFQKARIIPWPAPKSNSTRKMWNDPEVFWQSKRSASFSHHSKQGSFQSMGIIYHLYPEPHRFKFLSLGNPDKPKLPEIIITILNKSFNFSNIWIKLFRGKVSKLNMTSFKQSIMAIIMKDTIDDRASFFEVLIRIR